MEKPIIGIITTPDFDRDNDPQFLIDPRFVKWVSECGGIPFAILPPRSCDYHTKGGPNPMNDAEIEDFNRILDMCDGFIKPGGYTLTDYHKYIYNYCVKNDVPYLGVCAGIQLMAFCTEENPKLKENQNLELHKLKGGANHEVIINPNSKLYSILGERNITVKSSHTKHIEDVKNLLVAAISSDNQIEALENSNCTYNLGVQWHPESFQFDYKQSRCIFESFINSAINYKINKDNKSYSLK